MEQDVKVFSSSITREVCDGKNNLYELLNVDPAKPLTLNEVSKSCTFQPKCDKYYEYKKKSKLKVKTVRDIRNLYEKDIDEYLPQSLEKQRNILLKRIRNGCSKDEDTKKLAVNILKSDNPVLRTSWQMLTNINPQEHIHSIQYILWNGTNIRVCGSRGGSNKFIYKFERHNGRDPVKNKKTPRKTIVKKKKCLLQNSLSLKIKPGPLTQKKYIDDSYQKHHVGNLELVNLPKPGLDVMPVYGSPMEPTMRNLLYSLRDVDGIISHKWAEFAVSMVGTLNKANAIQFQPNDCTTFDLNYKYDQKRMLMRRDIENVTKKTIDKSEFIQVSSVREDEILEEIGKVLSQMIDSVEISLNQDKIFAEEDEGRNINDDICNSVNSYNNNAKDKNKKKFGELGRLDVTVIRLPENTENNSKICNNAHCILGCICGSLNRAVIVKEHCGRLECMFECKCDFTSYKDLDNYDNVSNNLIPGLLKLDKEMNLNLSKEEQKFHQTVVFSGDKSILLKSHRRNWKASTKYSEFYKNMTLKNNKKIDRDLIVVLTKINCDNIEPWCMVHNLYKCFCKGKFVESVVEMEVEHFEAPVSTLTECDKIFGSVSNAKSHQSHMQTRPQREKHIYKSDRNEKRKSDIFLSESCSSLEAKREKINNLDSSAKSNQSYTQSLSQRGKLLQRQSDKLLLETHSISIDLDSTVQTGYYKNTCARVQAYVGRKYTNRYYRQMNHKIQEMEKDDQSLYKRLRSLINSDQVNSKNIVAAVSEKKDIASKKEYYRNDNCEKHEIVSHKVIKKVSTVCESNQEATREDTPDINVDQIRENIFSGGFTTNDIEESNKSKLVAWLEHSYKQYKKRCELGLTKLTLQAPQPKKMTLLPWNFILERYKERKNLFLVTKQKPFRMFMAVNRDHPFLQDCINIDDIRFADLYIYPITVKKLITNANDSKDSFCILCGHAFCWELIGSVTKVDDPANNDTLTCDESVSNDRSMEYMYNENENSYTESDPPFSNDEDTSDTKEPEMDSQSITQSESISTESSKWFVMTIENDFSEIQFYNRGFFVKYDSIIKAINIARYSQKTVRLSSQKCAESSTNSQFGIYAIPNANEDCVFIGPYETLDSLGIETIRSITHTRQQKRTRGYWITTNKIDNINVIDNPMSFMPTKEINPNKILCLKSKPNEKKDSFSCIEEELNENDSHYSNKDKTKLLKPIKISKSNNFYSVSTNSLLRLPIHVQKDHESNHSTENTEDKMRQTNSASSVTSVSFSDLLSKLNAQISDKNDGSITSNPDEPPQSLFDTDCKDDENKKVQTKESEESMFAVLKPEKIKSKPASLTDLLLKFNTQTSKETDVLPSTTDQSESVITQPNSDFKDDDNIIVKQKGDKPEGNTFAILKPEEINKRIINTNILISKPDDLKNNTEEHLENLNISDQEVKKDIENFLENSSPPIQDSNQNVFIISDDDDECTDKESSAEKVSCVWIECKNIKNLGWISGIWNKEKKLLSFQFPGFNFSAYYPKSQAFKKINEILSRKICLSSKMEIEWKIVTQRRYLNASKKLRSGDLGAHLVLTKHGPRLKNMVKTISLVKETYSRQPKAADTVDPEIETLE